MHSMLLLMLRHFTHPMHFNLWVSTRPSNSLRPPLAYVSKDILNDKHYNPAIAARLQTLVDGRQWALLTSYLDGLSRAHFRTAGYLLGEQLMPQLVDDDFWLLASHLFRYNAKAFLVTLMKSCVASHRSLNPVPGFFSLLRESSEDQRKALLHLLPTIADPSTAEALMVAVGLTSAHSRIGILLQCPTPVCGFLLLKTLREVEDDRALLVRTVRYLISLHTNFSFNLASLFRSFFGLEEVRGTFSLTLQPFELARLSQQYEAFYKVVQR